MAIDHAGIAATIADILDRLVADTITEGQAATELTTVLQQLVPSNSIPALTAQVIDMIARMDGTIVANGPPSEAVGEIGSMYIDRLGYQLYGPKGLESAPGAGDGWGDPTPLAGLSAYEIWRQLPGNEDGSVEDFIVSLTGPQGPGGTITEITVATGPVGSNAQVEVGGTPTARTLHLIIPRGSTGNTGATPNLTIGDVTTGAPGSPAAAEMRGTAANPVLDLTIPEGDRGNDGDDGDNGWSPILAGVADGERRVLQLVDWVGGEGDKPATGQYLGPLGLVATPAEAVNFRGASGSGTGDMIAANNLTDLTDDAAARTNLDVYSKGEGDARYPVLAGGKIDVSVLPALAINDTFTVASEAEMLSLAAQRGDLAIRSDTFATYILSADTPAVLGAWVKLPVPTDLVQSVAGLQGVITAAALKAALAIAIADVAGLQAALDAKLTAAGFATAAEVRAGTATTKTTSPKGLSDAAAFVDLGDVSGTVTLDFATGKNFRMRLVGNVTLADPVNKKGGDSTGLIEIEQDGTGNRTLAKASAIGGPAPTASTAANAVDVIPYYTRPTLKVVLSAIQKGV